MRDIDGWDLEKAVRGWRREMARTSSLSRREIDELEDHLRARVEVEMELEPWDGEGAAFEAARGDMGSAAALSREFARAGGAKWRRWLRVGWGLFGASFVLPVEAGPIFGPSANLFDWTWGWQAFVVGLSYAPLATIPVTAAMLLTMVKRRGVRPLRSRWLRWAVSASALFNVGFWGMNRFGGPEPWHAGFWVWAASFFCVAGALWARDRSASASGEKPTAA